MSDIDFSKGNTSDLKSLGLKDFENHEIENYKIFNNPSDFYMSKESKELEYDSSCILNNIHWGQLKLFVSELFSILYHLEEDVRKILYIGAANGSHIFVLAKFFPKLTFYLYDTQYFDKRLFKLNNIKIFKKYFEKEDIEIWKNKGKFFLISDIRTLTYDPSAKDDTIRSKNEENVWNDMKLQESWIEELRPSVSLVKFRLPFAYDFILKKGKTRKYLNGDVCFQIYNKPTSSESRLLIKDINYKDWDIISYERKMYYHNCITRNKKKFVNPITNTMEEIYPSKGLFNDFDSTYLTVIVMEFIKRSGEIISEESVKKKLDYVLDNITGRKSDLNSKRAGF